MLDKTIPYIGVLMVKDNPSEYPGYCLPEGYGFSMYKPGYEKHWAELKYSVGEFDSVEKAGRHFQQEFMERREELSGRCIFVKDVTGQFAATATLWYGKHFGNLRDRLHWVSVNPKHQGKGIAKALIAKALGIHARLGISNSVYLTTQTWSYRAVNIYLKFGFKPYMGEKPANWRCKNDFAEENKRAWDLIFRKINNYKK